LRKGVRRGPDCGSSEGEAQPRQIRDDAGKPEEAVKKSKIVNPHRGTSSALSPALSNVVLNVISVYYFDLFPPLEPFPQRSGEAAHTERLRESSRLARNGKINL
jgi:hypothetical protein